MRVGCIGIVSTLAVPLFLLQSEQVLAKTKSLIVCQAAGAGDVVVELNSQRFMGRTLSCIHGDFVVDLTPCAPNNGFGLSAPTGSAGLVAVVDRWQEYANHLGGVTSHSATSSEIYFSGGFNAAESGFQDRWDFKANRLTGDAVLTVNKENEEGGEAGKSETAYHCKPAHQKF